VRHRHSRCNLSTKRLAGTIEGELHAEWITTTSTDDESPSRQGFPKRETVFATALESLLELRSSTNSVHLMPLR
jgi:hypothetical protein